MLRVTQKARGDSVTLVAGIVVDVLIHTYASTCMIVKTEKTVDNSTTDKYVHYGPKFKTTEVHILKQ
jgi:hypothetical protein